MMNRYSPRFIILLLTILCGSAATAPAVLIYREVFDNPTSGNINITTANWSMYTGSSAQTPLVANGGISNLSTRPAGLSNVGQADVTTADDGFVFFGNTSAPSPVLVITSEYSGATPINKLTLTDISFYQGNTTTSGTFRVALEIDGAWYVSASQSATTVSTGGNFGTQAQQRTYSDFTGSTWSLLNFTAGSTLGISGTTGIALPTGEVTSFGVFSTRTDSTTFARFDTFEIQAIPEPAALPILLSTALMALTLRRNAGESRRRQVQ